MLTKPVGAPTKWTPDQDEKLIKLWTDGASCSEIAEAIGDGISRSAVIGRAHRLNLPKRIEGRRVHPIPKITKPKQHGNKGAPKAASIRKQVAARSRALANRQHAANVHFKPGSLPEEDDGVDVTSLIGFADRRIGHQCSWIHGDPQEAGSGFCGKPVRPGTQWCEAHYHRVYPGRV